MAQDIVINPAHWTISNPEKYTQSVDKLQQRIDSLSTKVNDQITKLGQSSSAPKTDELQHLVKLRDDIETLRKLANDFTKSIEKVTATSGKNDADRQDYQAKFNHMIDHLVAMDGFNKDGDLNKVTGPTLFWSKVHQDFAGLIALGKEGKTLESTLPGYLFDGLGFGLDWSNDDSSPLKQFWVRMSHEIASAVKGDHAELHALGRIVPSSAFVTDEWKVTKQQIEQGIIKSLLTFIYMPKDTATRDFYLMDSLPKDDKKNDYAQKYIFVKEPPALYYVKKNLEISTIPLEQEDRDHLNKVFANIKSDSSLPIAKRDDVDVALKSEVSRFMQEGKTKQGIPYAHKEGVSLQRPIQYEVKTQEDLNKLIGKDAHEDSVYKAIQQKWQDKVKRATLITEKIKQTSNILKDSIREIEQALKSGNIQDKSELQARLTQLIGVSNELFELQKHLVKNEKRMENDLEKLNSLMTQLKDHQNLSEAEQKSLEQQLEAVSNDMVLMENFYDNDLNKELKHISNELMDFEKTLEVLNKERDALLSKIDQRPAAISGVLPALSEQEQQKIVLRDSYDRLANSLNTMHEKLVTLGVVNDHASKTESLVTQTKTASILNDYTKYIPLDDVSIEMAASKNMLTSSEANNLKEIRTNQLSLSEDSKNQIIKSLTDVKNYLTKAYQTQNLTKMPASDFNQLNAISAALFEVSMEMKKTTPDTEKILQNLYALQHITNEIQKANPPTKNETTPVATPVASTSQNDRSWGRNIMSRMGWGSSQPALPQVSFGRSEVNTNDMVNRALGQVIRAAERPIAEHRQEKANVETREVHMPMHK